MQLIFQIPVIDLRQAMHAGETINVWPSPEMSKAGIDEHMKKAPFIRNFGKIDSSPEGYYCNINCVKYSYLSENGLSIGNTKARIFDSFKRLYSDGIYTTRAEFGFTDNLEALAASGDLNEPLQIIDVLKHYMSLPLNVQDMSLITEDDKGAGNGAIHSNNWRSYKLGNLGSLFAKNYCRASIKNKEQPPGDEYVINGETCITLAYAVGKNILFPANSEKLDEFTIDGYSIKLFGYQWFFEERTIKVWLFQLSGFEALESKVVMLELQNRRANLFRLNAEKETIRIMANTINAENANPSLKNYIKKTPVKIYKKERFSNTQDAVRNFALQSEPSNVQFINIEDLRKILDEYGLDNLKTLEQGMKTTPHQKVILFITSNPNNTVQIDAGEQFKRIEEIVNEKLHKIVESGYDKYYFKFEPKFGVERDKLMDILSDNEPDILHITLHGSEEGLIFQDKTKKRDPLSVEEFVEYIKLLSQKKTLEVIILLACNSLKYAEAIKDYCKYAICTNHAFYDTAAQVYTEFFYENLCKGKDVAFCHDRAVLGIRFNKPPFEAIDDKEVYNIPQLIFVNQPPKK